MCVVFRKVNLYPSSSEWVRCPEEIMLENSAVLLAEVYQAAPGAGRGGAGQGGADSLWQGTEQGGHGGKERGWSGSSRVPLDTSQNY